MTAAMQDKWKKWEENEGCVPTSVGDLAVSLGEEEGEKREGWKRKAMLRRVIVQAEKEQFFSVYLCY
jgi:hypothetical protein